MVQSKCSKLVQRISDKSSSLTEGTRCSNSCTVTLHHVSSKELQEEHVASTVFSFMFQANNELQLSHVNNIDWKSEPGVPIQIYTCTIDIPYFFYAHFSGQ